MVLGWSFLTSAGTTVLCHKSGCALDILHASQASFRYIKRLKPREEIRWKKIGSGEEYASDDIVNDSLFQLVPGGGEEIGAEIKFGNWSTADMGPLITISNGNRPSNEHIILTSSGFMFLGMGGAILIKSNSKSIISSSEAEKERELAVEAALASAADAAAEPKLDGGETLEDWVGRLDLGAEQRATVVARLTEEGVTPKQLQTSITDKDLVEIGLAPELRAAMAKEMGRTAADQA